VSTYLQVGNVLLPLDCESTANRAAALTTSEFTGVTGAVTRFRAPRPRARVTLGFDASRPHELRALTALVNGEFGPGPFRLVDAWAQRTNAFDWRTSILDRWKADPLYSSALRPTDDGSVIGRALVNVPSGGVSMAGGVGYYAPAPPAGRKVTVSAFVAGTAEATVKPMWRGADGTTLAGTASLPVSPPAGGVMTRIHVTETAPATVASGSPVTGVSLLVAGTTTNLSAGGPCVTWSDVLLPYMDGQCPLRMVPEPASYDVQKAWGTPEGQSASASITFVEVGQI
jgi:hypothetical protein